MKPELVATGPNQVWPWDITKLHGPVRPHVSNDNPYSESHFKTLKYRPEFPATFGSIEDAHAFCTTFYAWYNTEHRHSGIGMHTPTDLHHATAAEVQTRRAHVLTAAYVNHPERFVRRHPTPLALPTAAWINRPLEHSTNEPKN